MKHTIWMPGDPGRQEGNGEGNTDGQEGHPLSSEWWMESFNATAWSTLKKRLQSTGALVVCAQECGITASMVGDAGRWAAA